MSFCLEDFMIIRNEIEHFLKEVRELERFFREAQHQEILPLSFFSSSIDILNRLRSGIYEIEATQVQAMQEHLKKSGSELGETNEAKEPKESLEEKVPKLKLPEEKTNPAGGILADTIGRKINPDFGKSLSLNDRFMFQRDLFHGNVNEMDQAFTQVNAFQSLNEVLAFLSAKCAVSWSSDAGIVLKQLLEKRFT